MHSSQWFMRRRFLNIIYQNCPYLAHFWPAPLFDQICITIPQEGLQSSSVKVGLVVLEKKSFKGKR